MPETYALLSVTNKDGIVELAKELSKFYTLLASGGTAEVLRRSGLDVISVSDHTGHPEILGGRVKTLHPRIHGAILAKDTPEHTEELRKHDIGRIAVVVCNLYAFEETVRSGAPEPDILEQIDIGGPTLIRAAAKNYPVVSVLVDPEDYGTFIKKLPDVDEETRRELAKKAFHHVTMYDMAISRYFGGFETLAGDLERTLRYGENPHQTASLYTNGELFFEQLHGKEISYNNILDVKEGFLIVSDFEEPACAVIKHRTPCGVATGKSAVEAYEGALMGDKMSAYGGVYCFNCEIDETAANEITKMFVDVLLAPSFTESALQVLQRKQRMVILKSRGTGRPERDIQEIPGGFVVQEHDNYELTSEDYEVVSEKDADKELIRELLFAWKVVKHSRSNAIAVTKRSHALGIGSGQTSRVDAVKQAIAKAGDEVEGAVMASDAFFPFRDSVDIAAEAGIKAVIVPRGSIRDQESIDAANEHGMVLVHTKVRCFKH